MNKFVEKYKHERKRGYSEYEAFGIVANHIAVVGTFDEPSNLTSYERHMKLSGMKESDFE